MLLLELWMLPCGNALPRVFSKLRSILNLDQRKSCNQAGHKESVTDMVIGCVKLSPGCIKRAKFAEFEVDQETQ